MIEQTLEKRDKPEKLNRPAYLEYLLKAFPEQSEGIDQIPVPVLTPVGWAYHQDA